MKKTIALVETFSAKTPGHYKAFMSLFAQSILNINHKVLVIMPDKELIDEWIAENCPEKLQNYYSYNFINKNKSYKVSGRFNAALDSLSIWRNVQKQLKAIEKQHKHKIDLVFLNFLDIYLANFLHPWLIDRAFSYSWAGLYFHPWHMRLQKENLNPHPSISEIDTALMSKKCKAIVIHDEGIIPDYNQRLDKQKAILFPEIADGTPPNPNMELVKTIKTRANGRTVVGLVGFVHYKGLNTLIKVAKKASADDFFFVFIGRWTQNETQYYTPERKKEADDFFNDPPENVFIHLNFVKEGADFNAVFSSFDIPFLVYDDFPSSSNNLTKAAIFDKLVIASKGFCVGDDVERYALGVTIEQGNVQESIEALYQLKTQAHSLKPRFEEYKMIHSKKMLEEKFLELID